MWNRNFSDIREFPNLLGSFVRLRAGCRRSERAALEYLENALDLFRFREYSFGESVSEFGGFSSRRN